MKNFIIVIVVLGVLGTVAYFLLRKKTVKTKAEAIKVISIYTGLGSISYEPMSEAYLIARANAINSGSETFKDQDVVYVTKTGKKA